jgi:1-acyl-sn-glycerol-3-phosphate acyltransferase
MKAIHREALRSVPSMLVSAGIVARFRAKLLGKENIPTDTGVLLVGNHAFMALDSVVLGALLLRETGRIPRWLAERNLFRFPGFRSVLRAWGAIPGEPDHAVELLTRGELVCVYPGGIDDSFKLRRDKYTLKWQARAGFARVAMRARVPIVPLAAVGADDFLEVVAREPWLGRRIFGSARYDIPLAIRGKDLPFEFHALPAVSTYGDPDDPADVERVRRQVHDAVDAVLAPHRAKSRRAE